MIKNSDTVQINDKISQKIEEPEVPKEKDETNFQFY